MQRGLAQVLAAADPERRPPGAQRARSGQGSQTLREKRAIRSPLVSRRVDLGLKIGAVLPRGQVTVSLPRSIARVLYLTTALRMNGRWAFSGRTLFDRLQEASEEAIAGHVVWGSELERKPVPSELADDVVRDSLLEELRPT